MHLNHPTRYLIVKDPVRFVTSSGPPLWAISFSGSSVFFSFPETFRVDSNFVFIRAEPDYLLRPVRFVNAFFQNVFQTVLKNRPASRTEGGVYRNHGPWSTAFLARKKLFLQHTDLLSIMNRPPFRPKPRIQRRDRPKRPQRRSGPQDCPASARNRPPVPGWSC